MRSCCWASLLVLLWGIMLQLMARLPATVGQGLIGDQDKALGASGASYRRLTDAYIRNLSADINKRFKLSCTGDNPNCVLGADAAVDLEITTTYALLRATSPLTYSSLDPYWTDSVSIILPSIEQRPCFTCTACAVAYAASSAIASVLKIDVTETQISPMDLYYCRGVSRTCTSGGTLREMLDLVINSQPGLKDARCQPYQASARLLRYSEGLCATNVCSPLPDFVKSEQTTSFNNNRWTPTGTFQYVRLSSQYEIMEHIRAYGSVVTQFDIYDDLQPFYADSANKHEVYIRKNDSAFQEAHALILVGYHIDADYNNSYWVAQNSWGPKWADNGRFKLALEFPGLTASNTYGILLGPIQLNPVTVSFAAIARLGVETSRWLLQVQGTAI